MPFITTEHGWIHINTGRQRRRRCASCTHGWADKLCDYPTAKGKTCDAPICNRCARSVGDNLDYCPKHQHEQPAQAALLFDEVAHG